MPAVQEQIRSDVTASMKAGDRTRAGALRLILSELQKAEKAGGADDEQTVLRRERKRRVEAATQFRDAGRTELAEQEESEAELISSYLPSELSDGDLRGLVEAAVSETGAESMKDMGRVMGAVMKTTDGRADGKRVQGVVREVLGA